MRLFEGERFRPHVSFPNLIDCVRFVDEHGECGSQFQVIDLENLYLGDMLVAPDAAATIKSLRDYIAEPPVTIADFQP